MNVKIDLTPPVHGRRDRHSVNEEILSQGFLIREAIANATQTTLDALTHVHNTDLERRQLRTELLRQSVKQLNTAFGNIGKYLLVEVQTCNSTQYSRSAFERLIREGEENVNFESTRFNRSDRSTLLLSVMLLVMLCALVALSCFSTWQETQRAHRAARGIGHTLQHLLHKLNIIEKVATGTHQSVVRLSLNQVYHRFGLRCDELSTAMIRLERKLMELDLRPRRHRVESTLNSQESTSTHQPTSSESSSIRSPSPSVSLEVYAPETPSSPGTCTLEARAECWYGWIDAWDVNEANIAMSVTSVMRKTFSAFQLWEPVLKVIFEKGHHNRVVLANYFTERVREQAIEGNRNYRTSDRERRIMVPTRPQALDLFYPPQCLVSSFNDPFANYRPSPLFSKNATGFNLSLTRVMAELAEIMDKDEAMAAGDEKPRYLNLWGRVPHGMNDGTYPDKNSEEYQIFSQRLPVSAGLAYFAVIARNLFTTDQSGDCRRQHINCTVCSDCRRFVLCPFKCRQCANQIDFYKAVMYDPHGAAPDVDAATVQDLLYHQLVYSEEAPAAFLSIYPYARQDKDEADNVCTRRRWQQGIVSTNATILYNRVLSCEECNKTHLVLHKKTGPRPQIMGSVTYTDSSPLPEEVVNSPLWQTTIEKCPVPTRKANIGEAYFEANRDSKTQGPGRANQHLEKFFELVMTGDPPLSPVPLTTAPISWYIGDRNIESARIKDSVIRGDTEQRAGICPQPIEGAELVQRVLDAEVTSLNSKDDVVVVTYHQQGSSLGFRKVIQHLIAGTIHD